MEDLINADEYFMEKALKQAEQAFSENEVPIGAVIVFENKIIGKGFNQTEKLTDVTAHAEILAITSASQFLGSKFLHDCTMYITVEPCLMCIGAIKWSRLSRVVIGAKEPKSGFSAFLDKPISKKIDISFGLFEERCADLMSEFFRNRRD